jgi:hypothetical protein
MRGKARPAGLLVLLSAFVVLAVGASPAHAAFGIKSWEALTCKENSDTPTEEGLAKAVIGKPPLPKDPEQCTGATEPKWYRQASGHPNFGITDFELNTLPEPDLGFPEGFIKDNEVHLPEGLNVNPEATPTCTIQQAEEGETGFKACAIATGGKAIVGANYFTVALEAPTGGPPPECATGKCTQARVKVPVFNVEPFEGVPSMVAFPTTTGTTFIVGDLDPTDQSVIFRVSDIESPLEGGVPVVGSRLVFNGRAGDGTYLTMPSNCTGEVGQTTTLHVDSHEGAEDSAAFTTAKGTIGCNVVPFEPGVEVKSSGDTDSPNPTTVNVKMPFTPEAEGLENSRLLTAKVTLPEGTSINPSLANGLQTCSDAQFGKGTDNPVQCPAASKIGTVEVDTPAIDQPLGGTVYAAEPLNQVPTSGEMFRIFIHAFNTRYGVNVRLLGNIFTNQSTGQVTALVDNNPQQPFTSFRVNIDGGPHGALTSPYTCGPHQSNADYTPWGTPEVKNASAQSQFELSTAPGGGPCANTLGQRPFNLGYNAGTTNPKAGAYSPFELHLVRPDGQQELRRLSVTLPPGMSAKLAGLSYCPEASITAAASKSGKEEQAAPSCPGSSLVGGVTIKAGSGADPYTAPGKVYFAGPYKGAPVSLVFITPAVAGPYDLGNVVVRTALNIEPETGVVNAVSDEIPWILGGIKLDIRTIDININRDSYTINPTNCSPFGVTAAISGGGSNPDNEAAWSTVTKNNPFTATDCNALKFKPKFSAKILGGKKATKRRQHPKLQAVLQGRFPGDANVARTAFTLPKTTILDQSNIKTICTRVQLSSNSCPSRSVYGHAKATSPLIEGALKGPVYLTSSSNKLPDLLADLKGQVNIRLRGVILSKGGRLKTVFRKVPDLPVKKFTLEMNGGKKGLLINTSSLCKKKQLAKLNIKAQNGKQLKNNKLRIKTPCKGKKKKKGKK